MKLEPPETDEDLPRQEEPGEGMDGAGDGSVEPIKGADSIQEVDRIDGDGDGMGGDSLDENPPEVIVEVAVLCDYRLSWLRPKISSFICCNS